MQFDDPCREGTRVVTGYVPFGVGAGATATGLSFLEAAPGAGTATHRILTFLGALHAAMFVQIAANEAHVYVC